MTPQEIEKAALELEGVADDIRSISETFQKLKNGRLKESTLILLIAHDTRLAKRDVEAVLSAASLLGVRHLKPTRK